MPVPNIKIICGGKIKTLTNLLPNPLDPNASKGSGFLKVGVGKVLVKALELPEANPEELKVLKWSNAAYEIKYKIKTSYI